MLYQLDPAHVGRVTCGARVPGVHVGEVAVGAEYVVDLVCLPQEALYLQPIQELVKVLESLLMDYCFMGNIDDSLHAEVDFQRLFVRIYELLYEPTFFFA